MSIEDEIRQRKEELQAKRQAEEEQTRRRAEMDKALKENGFSVESPPILQTPSPELRALIEEARPSMVYIRPKIIRELPDGTTRCRFANPGESPDTYSLDVPISHESVEYDRHTEEYWANIWFFTNGMVALVIEYPLNWNYGNRWKNKHLDWDTSFLSWHVRSLASQNTRTRLLSDIPGIRRKLIDQIIKDTEEKAEADKKPKPVPEEKAKADSVSKSRRPDLPPAKSEGCYIATSVYGSYDCPEVRVLRRYRDVVLRANPLGRLFVKAYYAVSPFLVKRFGKTAWFQTFWRRLLDAKIAALRAEGISDTAYQDRVSEL